jgi:transposase
VPPRTLLLYTGQRRADEVKQEAITRSLTCYPIGTDLGLRTTGTPRCERQERTVPQVCQAAPSKACRAPSAITGTRQPGTSVGLQSVCKEVRMEVYTGIDWSENKHDVVFMNKAGVAIAKLTIQHTVGGFLALDAAREKLDVAPEECLVCLETAHNLLIDFLWSRGYRHVYVIPPSVVKANRGRQGQSRARTDPSDAALIADILRTDRGRLQPWHPDSLLTRQIRAKVSLVRHLTRDVVRTSNRLRAVLSRYYPAALHVFSSVRTQICLAFIRTYPTPREAAALSFAEFEAFATGHGYPHPGALRTNFARLRGPYPQPTPETVLVYQEEAVQLAVLLLAQVQANKEAKRQLKTLFVQHPDAPIFESLPGAGDLLAPALLAKFGDDRQRFPTSGSVQALAGTCPVTVSSGKRKSVHFRYACDRAFRDIAQKWAMSSVPQSLWAAAYWQQTRPRCDSNSHAYRCLANRWLSIAWAIWQKRECYDETYHLQQRALRSKKPS